jgi:hypothetical protein
VAQPAPAPAVQATPEATIVAPPPVSPENIEKAREALRQKMKELESQPAKPTSAPTPAPAVAKPGQAKPPEMATKPEPKPMAAQPPKKPAAGKGMPAFPPIPAPPPSVSADKQQRLAELLRKYKSEEITPEEYHVQRAKVMAEP